MTKPPDDEPAREHPQMHEHLWEAVTNGWGDTIGYECACGAYKSA